MQNGLKGLHGSYSFVGLTEDRHLLAGCDPWKNRPLAIAQIDCGVIIASETTAFDMIDAKNWYELQAGEILDISQEGMLKSSLLEQAQRASCIIEKIYFQHETSLSDDEPISRFRYRMGAMIARNHPGQGEVVTAIPESSCSATLGYAQTLDKPEKRLVLKRRGSVGRSFIKGEMGERSKTVDAKFTYSPEILGTAMDEIEDSVVNGTTMGIVSNKVWEKGATRQDLRPTAPAITADCQWGTNLRNSDGHFVALDPESGERLPDEEIAKKIGVTTIEYPTLDELKGVIAEGGQDPENYCFNCMGGRGLEPATLKSQPPAIEEFKFVKAFQ
jgi:amidophosphoribosyltransferase